MILKNIFNLNSKQKNCYVMKPNYSTLLVFLWLAGKDQQLNALSQFIQMDILHESPGKLGMLDQPMIRYTIRQA